MVMLPRQEGKTELGIRLGLQLLESKKHRTGIFLTKSKQAAKKMAREKFTRIFDPSRYHVNTEAILSKSSPSCLFIDSVDKQPDKLRGGTYHYVDWAEVAFSQFDHGVSIQDVWGKIIAPTLRETNGLVYLESTPNGRNGWHEMWGKADELGFKTFSLGLSKLVELGLRSEQEQKDLQRLHPPLVYRQEYECEFISFSGSTYAEFAAHHIWPDMPPPSPSDKVFFALDWGWRPSATCVLFAYVQDGVIHVFDEIYGMEMLLTEIAQTIRGVFSRYAVGTYAGVADHDPRAIDDLTRSGIPVAPASKSNVRGSRLEIKQLLHTDKLYIHPRCQFLIKDLQAASWDPVKDGEIAYNASWGHYDAEAAIRYLTRMIGSFRGTTGLETIQPHGDPLMDLRRESWL
jgi:hypothetical protein